MYEMAKVSWIQQVQSIEGNLYQSDSRYGTTYLIYVVSIGSSASVKKIDLRGIFSYAFSSTLHPRELVSESVVASN